MTEEEARTFVRNAARCGALFFTEQAPGWHLVCVGCRMSLMTAPTRSEVELAIARIEKSRDSHVRWADYFDRWPDEEPKYEDSVGSRERNRRVVEEYDQVLGVLRRVLTTTVMSQEQARHDAAHDPSDYHCLIEPCEWHPAETRIQPPATVTVGQEQRAEASRSYADIARRATEDSAYAAGLRDAALVARSQGRGDGPPCPAGVLSTYLERLSNGELP